MKSNFFKRLLFVIIITAMFGVIVMLLWNWLLPSIFGLVRINFWKALGLLFLVRIFFGRFCGNRRMLGGRNRFRERWINMSPEERESWIKKFRTGCPNRRGFENGEIEREA